MIYEILYVLDTVDYRNSSFSISDGGGSKKWCVNLTLLTNYAFVVIVISDELIIHISVDETDVHRTL